MRYKQWKRVAWQVAGLTVVGAGCALAATSGTSIDAPINGGITILTRGVGPAAMAAGLGAWASTHIGGSEGGRMHEKLVHAGIVGGGITGAPTITALFGFPLAATLGPSHIHYGIGVLIATNFLILGGLTGGVAWLRRRYEALRTHS